MRVEGSVTSQLSPGGGCVLGSPCSVLLAQYVASGEMMLYLAHPEWKPECREHEVCEASLGRHTELTPNWGENLNNFFKRHTMSSPWDVDPNAFSPDTCLHYQWVFTFP